MIAVAVPTDLGLNVVCDEALDDLVGRDPILLAFEREEQLGSLGRRLTRQVSSVRGEGLPTPRTVIVVGADRLSAVSTRLAFPRGAIVTLGETGLLEDGIVVLLGADVLVDRPHVGVDRPVDAVFDLAPVVALATHPSDSGVPEIVGVDRLVDPSVIGGSTQLRSDRLRRERPVIVTAGFVAVAGEAMEERDVVSIRAWMQPIQVASKGSLRVDDRIGMDLCTLEPRRVGVRRVGRSLALEVDVSDAERPDEGESSASIGEELDQCDIPHVVRAVAEGLDVLRQEHIVGSDLVGRRFDEVDVLGPGEIGVDAIVGLGEELPDGELVVSDCSSRESGIIPLTVLLGVPQIEDELVEGILVEFDQRDVEAPSVRPEILEVLCDSPVSDSSVEFADESPDVWLIDVVELLDLPQLSLESISKTLKVIQIAHVTTSDRCIMNLSHGKITFLDRPVRQDTNVAGAKRRLEYRKDPQPHQDDGTIGSFEVAA